MSSNGIFVQRLLPGLIFCTGVAVRAFYAFGFEPFLHWDEAPQALMAKWISEGSICPIVHFQLPYIGAVEQYPLALLMLVVDDDVFALNVFYFSLSVLSLVFSYLFYRQILGVMWANLAFVLSALPFPLVLLFSLQAYSFGGLVFFVSVSLWASVAFVPRMKSPIVLVVLGLINGLALYNNVLFVGVLGFTLWLVYATERWRGFGFYFVGFLTGYSPMIYFNLTNGFISYKILVAKFLGVTREQISNQGFLIGGLNGFLAKISGQGIESDLTMLFRFPAFFSDQGYLLQISGIIVMFGSLLIAVFTPKHVALTPTGSWSLLPSPSKSVFIGCCVLTSVLAVSQVRYLTALVVPLPILIGEGLLICKRHNAKIASILAFILLFYLVIGHMKVLKEESRNHKDEYAPVFKRLEERNFTHGYASYQFQAYSAFFSDSRIKISPQIGPVYLDKIPSYSQAVDLTEDVFYVIPADSAYLEYLRATAISFELDKLVGWWIVSGFSKRVYPRDLLSRKELSRTGGYKKWSYKENPSVLNVYRGGH